MIRFVLTYFDGNGLHSFSFVSGAKTNSIQIYYNLPESTGARKSINHRYD